MSDAWVTSGFSVLAVTISSVISWVIARQAKAQISEVHLIVNNQRTEMMNQIDAQKTEISDLRARIDDLIK